MQAEASSQAARPSSPPAIQVKASSPQAMEAERPSFPQAMQADQSALLFHRPEHPSCPKEMQADPISSLAAIRAKRPSSQLGMQGRSPSSVMPVYLPLPSIFSVAILALAPEQLLTSFAESERLLDLLRRPLALTACKAVQTLPRLSSSPHREPATEAQAAACNPFSGLPTVHL